MNNVLIKTKGLTLKARIYGKVRKGRLKPTYIFFGGWNPTSIAWTPTDLLVSLCAKKHDCICVTVFFRGMGSDGDINTLTRADFLEDALAFYDYIDQYEGVDREAISLVGESFGSYIASLLTAERPVQKLILRVPTDFSNEGFRDVPQIRVAGNLSRAWKLQKHEPDKSAALRAVHAFTGKTYIIASGKDAFIPAQTIDNYVKAVSAKKVSFYMMHRAGHGLISPLRQYEYFQILSRIMRLNS